MKQSLAIASALAALAWLACRTHAATGSVSTVTDKWTVDDLLLAEKATEFEIAPDGQSVVWVKSAMDKEKGDKVSNLFLSSLTEENEVQLTRGADTCSNPAWSPQGQPIAFLSNRPSPKSKKEKDGDDKKK